MRGLDEIDRELLRLLLEEGRRPYSSIADDVGLSAPAVSDRVERLQELGLVRRFTVDLDRSMLREGVPVLVDLQVEPGNAKTVSEGLESADPVEHVFETAGERVVCTATVPQAEIRDLLAAAVDLDAVASYDVDLLAESSWSPSLGDAELAPDCAECGNTVTVEGESVTLDGTVYQFCCSSCRSQFVDQYEQLQEGA
jgi:DNA-binding Lrp family transcriptional regulator/endogenous inhibitor of DNA gyrase (YacG/DUF329 family)